MTIKQLFPTLDFYCVASCAPIDDPDISKVALTCQDIFFKTFTVVAAQWKTVLKVKGEKMAIFEPFFKP